MTNKNLEEILTRFEELENFLQDPKIISNATLYSQYLKEHGSLTKVALKYKELKIVQKERIEAEYMAEKEKDPDLRDMAREEVGALKKREEELAQKIQEIMITSDEIDQRSVIVEIRAGTGGDEASLFSLNLFEMYTRFAERKNWKVEILDSNKTELGGFKEVIFAIKGKDVYKHMKFESGGHRVQRIPVTESSGRIHTSACTVAVLPEAEEIEVKINPKDLKIDSMRASGPGGQNVNKTSSAIRITHLPTGIVVNCQDTPEQHKNKMKAMRILRMRLFQIMQEKQQNERNSLRRSQQGSGDRNERIRTYNYPQNRVTDHRINHSIYNLEAVVTGGLDEFVEKLQEHEYKQRLEELGSVLPA